MFKNISKEIRNAKALIDKLAKKFTQYPNKHLGKCLT